MRPQELLWQSWGTPGGLLRCSWGASCVLLGCSWAISEIYFSIYDTPELLLEHLTFLSTSQHIFLHQCTPGVLLGCTWAFFALLGCFWGNPMQFFHSRGDPEVRQHNPNLNEKIHLLLNLYNLADYAYHGRQFVAVFSSLFVTSQSLCPLVTMNCSDWS